MNLSGKEAPPWDGLLDRNAAFWGEGWEENNKHEVWEACSLPNVLQEAFFSGWFTVRKFAFAMNATAASWREFMTRSPDLVIKSCHLLRTYYVLVIRLDTSQLWSCWILVEVKQYCFINFIWHLAYPKLQWLQSCGLSPGLLATQYILVMTPFLLLGIQVKGESSELPTPFSIYLFQVTVMPNAIFPFLFFDASCTQGFFWGVGGRGSNMVKNKQTNLTTLLFCKT